MKFEYLIILIAIAQLISCNSQNKEIPSNLKSDSTITNDQIKTADRTDAGMKLQEFTIKDTLSEKNLSSIYWPFLKQFLLPINSGNFPYLYDRVKLDSISISTLRKANLISVKGCEQFWTVNDKDAFLDDFNESNIFNICRWRQNNYPTMGFFIIETTNLAFARCYLITFKLKKDFIEPVDAILIYNGLTGSIWESHDRSTVLYDLDKIRITESCYQYNSLDLQNIYNASIDKDGKITLKLIKKISPYFGYD